MEFKEGETEHIVEVEILYDGVREMREAFTVHLKPDDNMIAEIQVWQNTEIKTSEIADLFLLDLHYAHCLLPLQTLRSPKPSSTLKKPTVWPTWPFPLCRWWCLSYSMMIPAGLEKLNQLQDILSSVSRYVHCIGNRWVTCGHAHLCIWNV